MTSKRTVVAAIAVLAAAAPAHAAVTISSAATSNMSCSGGVCTPMASKAVLNVGDLESLLASGNVEVTTTGSGVQAQNLTVEASLSWSASSTLVLDAYQSITVGKSVTVSGPGGMSFTTNDGGRGGYLLFGSGGNVTFANLSSTLDVNGTAYALVNSLSALASAIASNSFGAYALAANYDASQDGTYSTAPIPTALSGSFNGLGNAISNVAVDDNNVFDGVALFAETGASGNVSSVKVLNANVTASEGYVGGLVGINKGSVSNAVVTGSVTELANNTNAPVGGLVSTNNGGTIQLSSTNVAVTGGGATNTVGGLVGDQAGTVTDSFSEGTVSTGGTGYGGGLAGSNGGSILQSYSRAKVSGGYGSIIGGFVGWKVTTKNSVSQAYSTGRVKSPGGGYKGGFVGEDEAQGGIDSAYWDITTSGVKDLKRGAGNRRRDPGITGLTTAQLQSGLPAGFDSKVWAQNPKKNDGFPYLIANPPSK